MPGRHDEPGPHLATYTVTWKWHLSCDMLKHVWDSLSLSYHTLIKFWRCNKVSLATSALGQTLADFTRNGITPEVNPVDACREFPMELTHRGQPCCIVGIFGECRRRIGEWDPANPSFGITQLQNCRVYFSQIIKSMSYQKKDCRGPARRSFFSVLVWQQQRFLCTF